MIKTGKISTISNRQIENITKIYKNTQEIQTR